MECYTCALCTFTKTNRGDDIQRETAKINDKCADIPSLFSCPHKVGSFFPGVSMRMWMPILDGRRRWRKRVITFDCWPCPFWYYKEFQWEFAMPRMTTSDAGCWGMYLHWPSYSRILVLHTLSGSRLKAKSVISVFIIYFYLKLFHVYSHLCRVNLQRFEGAAWGPRRSQPRELPQNHGRSGLLKCVSSSKRQFGSGPR